MARKYVIIGAGHAGVQVAESLRDGDPQASIDVYSDEGVAPYQRPPLSKEYLHPDGDQDLLPLRTEEALAARGINLHVGVSISTIDRGRRVVQASSGHTASYDDLILATGARSRQLNIPGADAEGIHYLRTHADAEAIRKGLSGSKDVLIVGAGFIGLEFASMARYAGARVTVLEMAPRMMGRVLSRPMSQYFAELHAKNGVEAHFSEGIVEFYHEGGEVRGGVGSSGRAYPADLVLIGAGVVPNTELAAAAGLDVSNGVIVDQTLRTSDPNIWAVGDCCSFPDVRTESLVRLESVQNAVDHAKWLAKTLTQGPAAYQEIPWFWSNQAGARLQIAGRIDHEGADVYQRGFPEDGSFSLFMFSGQEFLGAESVNDPGVHLSARRILNRQLSLTPEQAADLEFDLKVHSRQKTGAGASASDLGPGG